MKRFSLYILATLLILKIQVLCTGCANIIPPEGGFKDSIPPVLTKASPPDSSNNFSEKKITLTFDEYIQLQNTTQELIMSPVPKEVPAIESRLKTLTIR